VRILEENAVANPASQSSAHSELRLWQLEQSTWKIVRALLNHRMSTDMEEDSLPKAHPYLSDEALIQQFMATDRQMAEIRIVEEWLEQTAPPFHPIETRAGYYPHTRRADILAEMDPDAPMRLGKALAAEDRDYETRLNETIFRYVRAGRLLEARDLCRACDQPWRAASLGGGQPFADEFIDGLGMGAPGTAVTGNRNRAVWKFESLNPHERATYAYLCGDAKNFLGAIPADPASDPIDIRLPVEAHAPADIFADLERSENESLRIAAAEPFHVFQKWWLLDRFDNCLVSFKEQISRAKGVDVEMIPALPHTLRFLVHITLLLRRIEYPVDTAAGDYLLEQYVMLLTNAGKTDLVALYTAALPIDAQIRCYSQFLQGFTGDVEERRKCLALAHQHGLPVEEIVRRTVQLVFYRGILRTPFPTKVHTDRLITRLNDPVTPADNEQIRALEWLLFDNSTVATT
ncbi:nuclear pore protein 84/107, partial [Blyttiomyces helicus]